MANVGILSLQAWMYTAAAVQRAQRALVTLQQLQTPKENVLRACMEHFHLQFKLNAIRAGRVGIVSGSVWGELGYTSGGAWDKATLIYETMKPFFFPYPHYL